ncbi:MAG: putative sugar phosphate isomerase YwlF [Syntrophorhabdaceae bacterium PtaU1.Bin034]|nr:MAG: putative sugar phosphate isomerase YwlF [Syntrophorhabdaceae bacterium PtaU1.Bin034]
MKIAIGSDHGGYELKEYVKQMLGSQHDFSDLGTNSLDSVDYPDYGFKVADFVARGQVDRGILICSTGIGMSVTANKVRGVRAALAFDLYTAMQSRRHLDANILVLGAQVTGKSLALEMVKVWLETSFEGGRHERRIEKIRRFEDDCHGCPEG